MNRSRSTTLLSITLGAILFSGALVPFLSQQAFAQADSQDNLVNPPWGNPTTTPNAIFRDLGDDAFTGDPAQTCLLTSPSGNIILQNAINGPSSFGVHGAVPSVVTNPGGASVVIPNYIDPLLLKQMQIELTFCPTGSLTVPPPSVSGVECNDSTGQSAGAFQSSTGVLLNEAGQTGGSAYIKEFWNCEPNPDWETINISYSHNDWIIIQAAVNTVSEGSPVGGTFEGVNSTALLVAGAQANALWLIPLITAIGIGIVVVNRKRFF